MSADSVTFKARLLKDHPSGQSTLTVTGKSVEIEGLDLVLHNAVDSKKAGTNPRWWAVSEPRTGMALFSNYAASEQYAIDRAREIIGVRGVAAVEARIEETIERAGRLQGGASGEAGGGGMKPYFAEDGIVIYNADCRDVLPALAARSVDAVVTDPPYGDTSLDWDQPVKGWLDLVDAPQLWCFGSMRFWLEHGADFREDWTYGQEIVWEKHNGSGFHADRFKRVHEFAVHWYRGVWGELYRDVPTRPGIGRITVRRKQRPPHTGEIADSSYTSEDGGPRLMRSVLQVRSEHGRALHPTQKPLGILSPLISYSVPKDGLVLDPFMGSGSTLRAAKDSGRRAIGIEVEEKFCEVAVERLAQGVLDVEGAAA